MTAQSEDGSTHSTSDMGLRAAAHVPHRRPPFPWERVTWGPAYPQHVGEVQGDGLQQGPVGPPPCGLAGGHVQVALADQSSHFFQDGARVDVVTQGRVHCCLLAVKAEREEEGTGTSNHNRTQSLSVLPNSQRASTGRAHAER